MCHGFLMHIEPFEKKKKKNIWKCYRILSDHESISWFRNFDLTNIIRVLKNVMLGDIKEILENIVLRIPARFFHRVFIWKVQKCYHAKKKYQNFIKFPSQLRSSLAMHVLTLCVRVFTQPPLSYKVLCVLATLCDLQRADVAMNICSHNGCQLREAHRTHVNITNLDHRHRTMLFPNKSRIFQLFPRRIKGGCSHFGFIWKKIVEDCLHSK